MRLLVFLSTVTLCFGAGNIIVTDSWDAGFRGQVKLEPTTSLHGWRITLVFKRPVGELQVC